MRGRIAARIIAGIDVLFWGLGGYGVARAWWLSEPLGTAASLPAAVGCVLLAAKAFMRATEQGAEGNKKDARG